MTAVICQFPPIVHSPRDCERYERMGFDVVKLDDKRVALQPTQREGMTRNPADPNGKGAA